MSEKDKKLIADAEKLHYSDWYKIDDMMEQADSEEAKERLKIIRSSKYHEEEYCCGVI